MKKLRMNVDALEVEKFEVWPGSATKEGTVAGASLTRFNCETQGEDPTCRFGTCNTGEPCSYCP